MKKFKTKYYTRQVDENDCGVAALSMVLKYFGTEKSLAGLRLMAQTTMEGTSAFGIKMAAEELGFNVRAVTSGASLFNTEGLPFPFIVHVLKEGKYPHYYVILSINGGKITLADPDPTVKITKVKKEELLKEWTNNALFFVPGTNYTPIKEKEKTLWEFFPLLVKQKKIIALLVIVSFVITFIDVLGSFYFQRMIDNYIPKVLINVLAMVSISLIFVYLIQQLLMFLKSILLIVLGQRLSLEINLLYIQHIFDLPMSFFATRRTGEITSRFSDAVSILDALSSTVLSLFLDLFIVIFTGVALGIQNAKLFLLVLLSIPFYAIIVFAFSRNFEKRNIETMQKNSILNSSIIEDINGIETLKALNAGKSHFQRIYKEFTEYLKKSFQLQKAESFQASLKTSVQLVMSVFVLWVGAQLVILKQISLGQLITFDALLTYFFFPLTNIINLQVKIQQAKVAHNRLNEVYLVENEYLEKERFDFSNYNIDFKEVSYHYGFKSDIISHINLHISENEKVTLVGMSGSGKTTLAKLLVNFFEPNDGQIYLGNKDISEMNKYQLREIINYLPQQPYIFTDSIYENLVLGSRPDVTMKEVLKACEIACIRADIEKLEFDFQTQLSADATTLSGGQKQRIALARALLTSSKILILDEATSNLDILTEKEILEHLFKLNKTIIFIAHRLSIAERSDKIVVLDKGKIVEVGTHQELANNYGFYSKLFTLYKGGEK